MKITDPAVVSAITALAEHGIPSDIQGLLVRGNPSLGIRPGAIIAALTAAASAGDEDAIIAWCGRNGTEWRRKDNRSPASMTTPREYRPATAPASAEPVAWLTMDTAPKNGTRVLIRAVCFQWNSDICQNVAVGHRAVEASFRAGMMGAEPEWREWCGDEKIFSTDWIVPEGWAPLPASQATPLYAGPEVTP